MTDDKTYASDIMTKMAVVSQKDSVAHLRNIFLKMKISSALVYDGRPVGMVTEKDMAKAFFEERKAMDELRVGDIMTRNVISVEPDTEVRDVASVMVKNGIRRTPVISKDEVMGIITSTDMAMHFIENMKGLVTAGELARGVPALREFHTVFKAAKLMNAKNAKRIIIMRDNKPAGILTERDISMASFGMRPAEMVLVRKSGNGIAHRHVRLSPLIVGDLMKTDLQTIQAKDDAARGAQRMLDRKIGSLLVYDKGTYEGLLSKGDFVNYLAKK